MRCVLGKQEKYNGNFKNDLKESDVLVQQIANYYKDFYDEKDYIIDTNFDKYFVIKYEDLNKEEQNRIKKIYKERFEEYSNEELEKYLKEFHIRPFDIAIIDKKTNKIIEGIEAKDICQMIKYDNTNLPNFYIQKMNFVKEFLEKEQQQKIELSYYFIDNKVIEKKQEIKYNFKIKDDFVPYGAKYEDLKIDEKMSLNPNFTTKLFGENRNILQISMKLESFNTIDKNMALKCKEYLKDYINIDNTNVFFTTNEMNFINLKDIKTKEFIVANKDGIEVYKANDFCNNPKIDIYIDKERFKLEYFIDKKNLEHDYIDTYFEFEELQNLNLPELEEIEDDSFDFSR